MRIAGSVCGNAKHGAYANLYNKKCMYKYMRQPDDVLARQSVLTYEIFIQ